jgi:LPS sulfotransferase NodH
MLNIGYQKRDFNFFDYELYTIKDPKTKKSFVFRGPASPTLEKGAYFSSIGPAFTYGCYTHKPYTQLISDEFGFPSINLGIQGAGPSYYNLPDNKMLLEIINRSKFVIVAVMSGRSCSNSLFKTSPESQEKLTLVNEKKYQPAHKLYEWLLENSDEQYIKKIVEETRDNFIKEYSTLLSAIKVPKILFWFSKRTPDYQAKYDKDVWSLFGKFPHLIDSRVIKSLEKHCDNYVECITAIGTPQILFNRFSGQIDTVEKNPEYGYSQSNYNMYYASPEMHIEAANFLLPSCAKYIGKQSQFDNSKLFSPYIQPRELIENLKGIHFETFLISLDSQDIYISEIGVKNYIYEKYEKVFSNLILPHELLYENYDSQNYRYFVDLRINFKDDDKKTERKQGFSKKNFSLVYDVIPYLLSKPSNISITNLAKASKNVLPKKRYAIVCTPRSGSSFLSDLLSNNECGDPIEHIREPFLYVIKHRRGLNINLNVFIEQILRYCSANDNNIFGTKIISHFWLDLINILGDKIEEIIPQFHQFKIIYLYREDKYAQAISKFLASKSKYWHSTAPQKSISKYHETVKDIDYNFDTIRKIYEQLISEEEVVKNFIQKYSQDNFLSINYEQLSLYPGKYIRKIIDFLEVQPNQICINSKFEKLSSDRNQQLVDKFKQEYEIELKVK